MEEESSKDDEAAGHGRGGSDGEDRDVDRKRPSLYDPETLQRLLVDCITFKSTIQDIEVVIKCGAKINEPVKRGLKPLHYAVYGDYVPCVQFLIEKGAGVNATDDIGYTPIHLCARKGNVASMEVLIENGAIVHSFNSDDEDAKALGCLTVEPLNLALENNHVDCVRLLLENGAKPDHLYFMGYEINLIPLENLECLEILLMYGADPNVFNRCGTSPLMKACRQQNIDACRMLLKYGAQVNLQCPSRFEQKTALHFAIDKGNIGIIHMLLRQGASPSRPDNYKFAALHAAVLKDRPDVCEMLLRWRADVDEKTDENATALMLACATPSLKLQRDLIELLLQHGADPNAHSNILSYSSPCLSPLTEYLKNIAEKVTYEIAHSLIKHGARVNFKGSTSIARLKDPHGVLHYLPNDKVKDRADIFDLLAEAGSSFDVHAIKHYSGLNTRERSILTQLSSKPLSARQLVRLYIRELMIPRVPEKVNRLPLPSVVRSYLLFGV
ncbi:ankyrin repeat and SOCS box protein 8-like [Gigantopelta aegis]|uniref:ankyrin repeat and SOCS box protein 8-like n=1 Tax=Gigantopelta aegis TaxID=1735272 RepID=UPI001B889157|nr:ankyrin repeat and SOCS box protein 8-like [Gigantopelta aegis]